LEPWGHTGPTGYVYILTLKKINEIYCQRLFPLNEAQVNEIIAFRALLESLRAQGIIPQFPSTPFGDTDTSSSTPPLIPIVGTIEPTQGQNLRSLAATIFAQPENLSDTVKCLYGSLLILIVLYIMGNVLKDVLYKDVPENNRKRFLTKWLTIDISLIALIIASYLLGWWCLLFPLIVALLISLLWTSTYPKHNPIKSIEEEIPKETEVIILGPEK